MTDQASNIYHSFEQAYGDMASGVEKYLTKAPAAVRLYTAHLAKSKGKFIRAFALLSASMDSQGLVPEEAVTLAMAVELLHLATLIHDDVIDDAGTRRGIETLQKKYGKRIAVICGDYLLSSALKTASAIPGKEKYSGFSLPDYIGRLCMGELCQEINHGNLNLSVYRYLSIINGKTAALFEAAFYGGAAFSESEEKRLAAYRRAGRCTGMIFQLMDDCTDYEADFAHAKKDVRSDYDQGVVTLPLIYTLEKDPELAGLLTSGAVTSSKLYPLVRKAGGLDFTRKVAGKYYAKAAKAIANLGLPAAKNRQLMSVLDKAYYGLKQTY